MPPFTRRKKLVEIRHAMTDESLRESLREQGQLLAVFVLGGVIVDGRRRDRFLRELGRTPRTRKLRTQKEAARVLWQLHPWHALSEYCEEMSLTQTAEFLGVSIADVSMVRGETRRVEQNRPFGDWRPNYKQRWERARRYIARCRQGLDQLTIGGVEEALRLPPLKEEHKPKKGR